MKRLFFLTLVFFSCTVDKSNLIGSWQAVAYYETGQTVDTPLDAVQLSFSSAGDYSFRSIGFYEERGQYRLAGNYLHIKDSTVQNAVERTMKILFLSPDSLKIGMETAGKSSTVFFGKIKQ